jgi:hypothetical protein
MVFLVMHGVTFLLGATKNSAAMRELAEVEHWVRLTSQDIDTISTTRAIFADSLITDSNSMDVQIILKLPIFQNSLERCTYISTCFSNLKTAANPLHEDFEKYLLEGLFDELNNLFPMGLSTDFVCDRFMDSDVFDDHFIDRTVLVLFGVSQLKKLPRFIQQEVWLAYHRCCSSGKNHEN